VNKQDIYKADPVLRFLRDRLHLTPARTFYIALALGVFDLLLARIYNLWFTQGRIIGALRDPEYLLTMFVIIPSFLYTYIWLPDGMWTIFDTLRSKHLVRGKDMQAYHENFANLSRRYDKKWVIIALVISALLQLLIIYGNMKYPVARYNSLFTLRFYLFRLPYGWLSVYAATTVVIRSILRNDWPKLFAGVEPQVNPLHADKAAGYGAFTSYIMNLLVLFAGLAIFLFNKALFQPDTKQLVIAFKPVYNIWLLATLIIYLIVGVYFFLYRPTIAARSAIKQAKSRLLNAVSDDYMVVQSDLSKLLLSDHFEIAWKASSASDADSISLKRHLELMKQLGEVKTQIEDIPDSPINRKVLARFSISYISIPISTFASNIIFFMLSGRAAMTQLKELLGGGDLYAIISGLTQLIIFGKLP